MANSLQRRNGISGMRLRTASAVLVLAVVLGVGVGAIQSATAQTLTVLYNFTGGADGAYPLAGLVRDKAGNPYGTTNGGGSCDGTCGNGVVFKVDTSGTETVLHTFAGYPSDGSYPEAGLFRDAAGNLYGTTYSGGASAQGTVFKVDTTGTETVLYSFTGRTTDGCYPYGGLVRDKAGNFYGTTFYCGASGYGTVFKLSKSGKETVLHSFAGGSSDGAYPYLGNLAMDTKGNLYGVTADGGVSGKGVVYKLSKSGTLTVLYSFAGGTTDGCLPYGTPVMDKQSNVYGTTSACGSSNAGIVWKVSKKGKETVLHSFAGGSSDGADPFAGVILDAKGNVYGDTDNGGASGVGTVYKLNKKGALTLLHSFAGSDGTAPVGGLIRDAKGSLYGTAAQAGSGTSEGTVWKLTP